MHRIAFNLTRRQRGQQFIATSVTCALLVILVSQFRSYPDEPGQPARGKSSSSRPFSVPRYLGVWMENAIVFFQGYGWVEAVRITGVDPGSPAQRAGLVSGDMVVWADGRHTRQFTDLADAVARSTGSLSLSIVKAATGEYLTLPPIRLAYPTAAAPGAPSSGPTMERVGRIELRLSADVMKESTIYAQSAGKGATAKGGSATKKDVGHVLKKALAPETEVVSTIRKFPWPPPRASSWTTLPPELLHRPGKKETLRDVSLRLEAAFRKAGYIEWGYYAVPKGFAVVTQLEQYADDGTPLAEPNRWAVRVPAPPVFSLLSYIRALFTATPGHFRIVVFILTSEPVIQDEKVTVKREEALKWVGEGPTKLPREYAEMPFDDDVDCTALIYEFDQPSREGAAKFQDPGLLKASVHLEKAHLLEALAK